MNLLFYCFTVPQYPVFIPFLAIEVSSTCTCRHAEMSIFRIEKNGTVQLRWWFVVSILIIIARFLWLKSMRKSAWKSTWELKNAKKSKQGECREKIVAQVHELFCYVFVELLGSINLSWISCIFYTCLQ